MHRGLYCRRCYGVRTIAVVMFVVASTPASAEGARETYKYLIDKGLKELGSSESLPKDR